MGTGILICGLNGAGKSTLGKALAEKLNFYFIDSEDLYFPNTPSEHTYTFSRTREEAEKALFNTVKSHENFVLASVKGDYGKAIYPFIQYTVFINTPKDIRIQRIKRRSFQKFGKRILLGGDLFEQENNFLNFVKSRAEDTVEEWVQCLNCPIIKIDGTKTVEENINLITAQITG